MEDMTPDEREKKLENATRKFKEFDEYYISYNGFANFVLENDPAQKKEDETAIVVEEENGKKFYILYGDRYDEMVEAAKKGGVDAAMEIFDNHPEEHSFWTDY